MPGPHRQYLLILGAVFGLFWVWLAIAPFDRKDWALENLLVAAFAVGIALSYRKFTFSRISYSLIFVFLCLHTIGAHFTYSEVPYDDAWRALTGSSFNDLVGWRRNNYDRVVHFSYGLLFAYPLREVFLRIADARGFWGYFLPLDFTLATSALFELFEWGAAAIAGGDLGAAYLGTQGDVWDAHKDMLLAGIGALVAMLITGFLNWRLQRDFGREWSDSLRTKDERPLGEDEIRRLVKERAH